MRERYEMLPRQKRIWDVQTAFPGTDICNIGGYLELEGKDDGSLLRKTMEFFVKTQSSFWTRVDAGSRLYFERITDYRMPEHDFREMGQAEVDEQIQSWICEPMPLYDSPLFDFRLLRLADRTVIFEKFHHLIADGYAVNLCARCQEQIYERLQAGETEFETDESYLREVQKQAAENEQRYKADEERGVEAVPKRIVLEDTTVPEMPEMIMPGETDIPKRLRFVTFGRRAVKPVAEVLTGYLTFGTESTGQTEWYPRRFAYGDIRSFGRAHRVSVESCIYGCLGIYLCRAGNGDGVAIARNLLNRSGAEMKEISLKVETLTFGVFPAWEMTAAEYLASVKKELAVQAREHISVSVRPDIEISYRPVRYLPSPKKGECREFLNSSVEIPLKIFLNDNGRELELQVKYQKETLRKKEVMRLIRGTLYLLEQCLENPDRKVGDLSLVEEGERAEIRRFNDTDCWKYTVSLPERFLHVAEAYPEKTALIYRGEIYTYARVRRMADVVQRLIADRADQGKRRLVGLCLSRSPWMPAAVYGTWLSGCGFLPVSPRDSAQRKKKTARMCALFLTDEMLEKYAGKETFDYLKPDTGNSRQVRSEYSEEFSCYMKPDIRQEVPAYEIFTSGTTGEPKMVMISHRSLSCRLEWMEEQFRDGTDIILQKTRNTFDVSVWELALPFAFGKTMCVLEDGKEGVPEVIAEAIVRNRVTMVHFVPSMFAAFTAYLKRHPVKLSSLKYVILSGEALDAELVREAKRLLPGTELYNLYGPAECTIDVSCYRCSGEEERIPIGCPVWNTKLTVRNERGELLPVGEKGELVVQGELVGIGYDCGERIEHQGFCEPNGERGNHSESCREIRGEKIYDSEGYCELEGEKAYRTGDMAVLEADGYLYYEGRKDRQIKLRGMRISLDEVESSLNASMPGVRHMVLCIAGRLIDFYQGEIQENEAEERAADILPYYSVPSEFIHMKTLPTGKHGKSDRDALREEYEKRQSRRKHTKERFSGDKERAYREKRMLATAKRLLERKDITLDANLFDLGMDSLTVLRFLAECEESGIALSYGAVYESPSIRKLAKPGNEVQPLVFLQRESEKKLILMVPFAGGTPLSCRKLAGYLRGAGADFAAVNLPCFGSRSVREAVNQVLEDGVVKEYQEICLIGSCVGSALAVGLAAELGGRVKGLMLCESLPYQGAALFGKVYSVWDTMTDRRLSGVLQALRGKRFEPGKELLACFRQDVRRSAEYLRKGRRITPGCRVVLVFGSEDPITAGYRRKYVRWRRWIAASYKVYIIPGAKHFLTEDRPAALAGIFRKEFMK